MKKISVLTLAICASMAVPNAVLAGSNIAHTELSMEKSVRNVSHGSGFSKVIEAHPGDIIEYKIALNNSEDGISGDVLVRDSFDSSSFSYVSNSLKVNGEPHAPGLTSSGLYFNSLDEDLIITYRAKVASSAEGSVETESSANITDGQSYELVSSSAIVTVSDSEGLASSLDQPDTGVMLASAHMDDHGHDHEAEIVESSVTEHDHQGEIAGVATQTSTGEFEAPETGASGISAFTFALLFLGAFVLFRQRNFLLKKILN